MILVILAKFKQYIHDPLIQRLIELWVTAEIWDGTSLKVCQKGIPQGSPISPILANLFLDELDEELLRKGYKYIRYADDYVILCKKKEDAEKGLELSKQVLENLLLKLDEEEITTSDRIDIRYALNHEEHEVHEEWNLINYQIELLDAR